MAVSIKQQREYSTMRVLILLGLFALSATAQATNNECRSNCGPKDDRTELNQTQVQAQGQIQGQGQSQSADATAVAGAIAGASADNHNSIGIGIGVSSRNEVDVNTSDYNANRNDNTNLNVAEGGRGGEGGEGGSAVQGQSQSSNNSNSSNNSSSQSTNLTFEGTGEAKHTNQYGNNVTAYAPAIYSASACTGGGVSGGASALGVGIALGGARQIKACQTLENARVLSSLNAELALVYLCANPNVDIGATLGDKCKPAVAPPIVVPDPPVVAPTIEVITDTVKGR